MDEGKLSTEKRHPELMMYAAYALANVPEAERVQIGLIYIGKDPQKPFAHEVKDTVTREEVDLFWSSVIVQSAKEIEMAFFSDASEVERNYDFCSAFGGYKVMDSCESLGLNT